MFQQQPDQLAQFFEQEKQQVYDVWAQLQDLRQVSDESGIQQTPFICPSEQQNFRKMESDKFLSKLDQQSYILQVNQKGQGFERDFQKISLLKIKPVNNKDKAINPFERSTIIQSQIQSLKNTNSRLLQDNKKLFEQCIRLRKVIIDKDKVIRALQTQLQNALDNTKEATKIVCTNQHIASVTQLKRSNQQYKSQMKIQQGKISMIENQLSKLKNQTKLLSKSFIQSSQNQQKCMDIIRQLKTEKNQLVSQLQSIKNMKTECEWRNSPSPSNSTVSSRKQYQDRLISNMKMIHDAQVRQLKTQLEFQNREIKEFKSLLQKHKIRSYYSFDILQS